MFVPPNEVTPVPPLPVGSADDSDSTPLEFIDIAETDDVATESEDDVAI